MRTTLDIDEPVLLALKELAHRQGRTAGAVASELIRRALSEPAAGLRDAPARFALRSFAAAAHADQITNELVNRLRDEQGI